MKRQFRQAYVEPTSEQDEFLQWKRAHEEEAQRRSPYSLEFCLLQSRAAHRLRASASSVRGCPRHCGENRLGGEGAFIVREYLTSVKRAKSEDKRARAEDKRAREIRLYAVGWKRRCSQSRTARLPTGLEGYWDHHRRPVHKMTWTMPTSAP